jgi:uncharacterized protein (DUF736 family)
MRKKKIEAEPLESKKKSEDEWLDLTRIASVELTSEDPNFPIESCFSEGGRGWRSGEPGTQIIRLSFDQPVSVKRVALAFVETEKERTHEFTLRWSDERSGRFNEIVRQQWNFSPHGSTKEVEDYRVNLDGVRVLEVVINPDLGGPRAVATLARLRIAR